MHNLPFSMYNMSYTSMKSIVHAQLAIIHAHVLHPIMYADLTSSMHNLCVDDVPSSTHNFYPSMKSIVHVQHAIIHAQHDLQQHAI